MKRILSIFLILQLLLCFNFIVFAEGISENGALTEEMPADGTLTEGALVEGAPENDIITESLEDNVEIKSYSSKAKVIDVIDEKVQAGGLSEEDLLYNEVQKVTLEILDGKYKGKIVTVDNFLGGNKVSDIRVEVGQKVVVVIEEYAQGEFNAYINSYERDIYLYILIFIFLLALAIVGRKQGLKTIVTLSITIMTVFFFMIPMILKGFNPILISVISSIFITIITLFIISGINRKSIAAIIGTAISVIISGVLAYVAGHFAKLSGLETSEGNMLMHIPQNIDFNFRELLFAGIIIGTLGAAMDMCMSLASSMAEIKKHNPDIDSKSLYKSGLNVGKDVMGTMTNTLILAYTGSSMAILMIFMAYNKPLIDILNLDIIATEIVRSIAGSIGVVLSVPITAYVVVIIEKIMKNKDCKNMCEEEK